MSSQTFAEYLNVQQVRDTFNLDLPQLKHAISKHELRLWAYIGNKKRDFDKQPISVIDLNYVGMPSIEEINRLDKLTVQEIEMEGWSITHLSHPHNFIAHKGEHCFMVTHENGAKGFRLPIIDDGNTIEHDGFIEIDYEKSPFDKNKNLAVLFNESELYLCQAKSNKSGHMCLLKPGCYITLNDVYIHQNELKKLDNQSQGSPQMLPHIRSSNLLKRADQIANLFNQICVEHPIRIDVEKITRPAQLINLAWIIAFCRMEYNSYADVSYKDFALNAMAENIRKALIDELQESRELHKLNAKYYDEVDFATETTVTKILSHKLPPDVIKSLLQNKYKKFIYKEDASNQPTDNPTDPEQIDGRLYRDSEIKHVKYHEDAIAIAIIGQVLPSIFPNKEDIHLSKDSKWTCFTRLKEALLKDGAKNVEIYREKNKDNSTIAGVDKHGATIDSNFKSFRGRLPNLIAAYKQLT